MKLDYDVFQEDRADCAMACLVIVARLLGRKLDLAVLKSRFPTPVSGMNIVQLLSIGERVGIRGRAVRLEANDIGALQLPAILHFGVFHFVVLEAVERSGHLRIIDPAMGRDRMNASQFSNCFSGIAIEVSAMQADVDLGAMSRLSPFAVMASIPNVWTRLAAILTVALCAQAGLFMFPLFIKFMF